MSQEVHGRMELEASVLVLQRRLEGSCFHRRPLRPRRRYQVASQSQKKRPPLCCDGTVLPDWPPRSVPVPSLATSSLLFLARGAPALVGLAYRGAHSPHSPLMQGEWPQIPCSAPRKLSEATGVLPLPRAASQRRLHSSRQDPSARRDCWPHTVTEALASVPRAANG